MTTIYIDTVTPSRTGKSLLVKAGAMTYYAKTDSGLAGKYGVAIEAETKRSDKDGKEFVWIEKWRSAPPNGAPAQTFGNATPQPSAFTATGVNLAFLPFVSNVVAHAIQAGHISTPADIAKWANTAYDTAINLKPDDFQ